MSPLAVFARDDELTMKLATVHCHLGSVVAFRQHDAALATSCPLRRVLSVDNSFSSFVITSSSLPSRVSPIPRNDTLMISFTHLDSIPLVQQSANAPRPRLVSFRDPPVSLVRLLTTPLRLLCMSSTRDPINRPRSLTQTLEGKTKQNKHVQQTDGQIQCKRRLPRSTPSPQHEKWNTLVSYASSRGWNAPRRPRAASPIGMLARTRITGEMYPTIPLFTTFYAQDSKRNHGINKSRVDFDKLDLDCTKTWALCCPTSPKCQRLTSSSLDSCARSSTSARVCAYSVRIPPSRATAHIMVLLAALLVFGLGLMPQSGLKLKTAVIVMYLIIFAHAVRLLEASGKEFPLPEPPEIPEKSQKITNIYSEPDKIVEISEKSHTHIHDHKIVSDLIRTGVWLTGLFKLVDFNTFSPPISPPLSLYCKVVSDDLSQHIDSSTEPPVLADPAWFLEEDDEDIIFVDGDEVMRSYKASDYIEYYNTVKVLGAYKRVDKKVKPVAGTFPQEAKVIRKFPENPLDSLPPLTKNPPEFRENGRLTKERLESMNINPDKFLWPEEEKLFNHILLLNQNAFAFNDMERGTFREDYFSPYIMPVVPHEPWALANIPIPPGIREQVITLLKTKLQAGVYEPSQSSYRGRWFCVLKKNGKLRLVHDLQPLNKISIRDAGIIPILDSFVEPFAGRQCYTALDLFWGFDARKVDPISRDLTAFYTPLGLLRLTALPMGYTNSPAEFQACMSFVLQDEMPHTADIFIDDLAIKGPTDLYLDSTGQPSVLPENPGIRKFIWEHAEAAHRIIHRIAHAGGTFSPTKVQLCRREAIILGQKCTPEGRLPEDQKIQKILSWPTPKTVKDVRGFLGLCGTVRIWILGYSELARGGFSKDETDYYIPSRSQTHRLHIQ